MAARGRSRISAGIIGQGLRPNHLCASDCVGARPGRLPDCFSAHERLQDRYADHEYAVQSVNKLLFRRLCGRLDR